MDKETEKFHESDGGFDFVSIVLIDPDDGVSFGHYDFPDYLLGDVLRGEQSILRHSGRIVPLLQFDELAWTHPQVIDVPTFEDIPEVLSEQQSFEAAFTVDHIDPEAPMNISHCFEGFPQWLVLLDLDIRLYTDSFHEGSDSDVVVELGLGLVGNSE